MAPGTYHPSLRRRLIRVSLLLTALVVLGDKLSLYHRIRETLHQDLDEHILHAASLLTKSSELIPRGVSYDWEEAAKSGVGPRLQGLFQCWDLSTPGKVSSSPELGSGKLPFLDRGGLNQPVFRTATLAGGTQVRVVGLRHLPFTNDFDLDEMRSTGKVLDPQDFQQLVVYAAPTAPMEGKLIAARWQLLLSAAGTLLAVWIAIELVTRWMFRPLARLTTQLQDGSVENREWTRIDANEEKGRKKNGLERVLAKLGFSKIRAHSRPFAVESPKKEDGTGKPSSIALPPDLPAEIMPLALAFRGSLERVNAARQQEKDFAYAAAHQLRTPVAGLLGLLDQALNRPREPEDLRRRVEDVREIGREIRATIESLMRVARLKSAAAEGPGSYLPAAILEEVAVRHRPDGDAARSADASSPVLRMEEMPAEPVALAGDPEMFRVLAEVLIENAVRYSVTGGIVSIRLRKDGSRLRLDVTNLSDATVTLPPEEIERLFQPFQRGSGVSVNVPGAGLGLSLAREAARDLGGSVEMSSLPNGLVRLTVILDGAESELRRMP